MVSGDFRSVHLSLLWLVHQHRARYALLHVPSRCGAINSLSATLPPTLRKKREGWGARHSGGVSENIGWW